MILVVMTDQMSFRVDVRFLEIVSQNSVLFSMKYWICALLLQSGVGKKPSILQESKNSSR